MSDYLNDLVKRADLAAGTLRARPAEIRPGDVANLVDELARSVERLAVYRRYAPPVQAMERAVKYDPGTLEVSLVRQAAREIDPEAMDDPKFPRSPKTAWKAALGLPVCRMTFATGPWLNAAGTKVLQDKMPSMVLVAGTAESFVMMHWQQRDGTWKFTDAWLGPKAEHLNSREALKWVKESRSQTTTP